MSGFDWEEYIECADLLLEAPLQGLSNEAQWRVAVSRAYYGAFCLARNVLQNEGKKIPETAEAHRAVVRILNRSSDRKRQQAGNWLKRLRQKRNTVDYNDQLSTQSPPKIRKKVESAITNAREILKVMND